MVALSEIAAIVATICATLSQSFYFLLKWSYIVGRSLAQIMSHCGRWISDLSSSLVTLFKIVWEDYFIFLEDLSQTCSLVYIAVRTFITFIWEKCLSFVSGLKFLFENANLLSNNFASELVSFLENIIHAVGYVLSSAKYGVVTFGSSVWYCLKAIPSGTVDIVTEISNYITNTVQEVYLWNLSVIYKLMYFSNSCLRFFFDVPIDSVLGLIFGAVLTYLLCRYYLSILSAVKNVLIQLYSQFLKICYLLWTGQFLGSQPAVVIQPVAHIEVEQEEPSKDNNREESNLCIVCQDRMKEMILFPCKHMCLCEVCSRTIKRLQGLCPVCRSHVRRTMKVYT